MSLKKQYKVIFFDWHKTLCRSLFWEHLVEIKEEREGWHEAIGSFLYSGKQEELLDDWQRGKVDMYDVVRKVSSATQLPEKGLLEELAESCKNMKFVSPEILPLVKKLREKGIRCVIATDNMDTFRKYTVPALKLDKHFDDILSSFDLRVLKKDVQTNPRKIPFFDKYLQSHNFSYTDALLLDDHADKTGVYAKVGFDVLSHQNTEEFLENLRKLV
jgi:FMN phosphatase YigB (HAD superfamily)